MRKFAPIAMLMALMASLLLGGVATAQAGVLDANFKCNQAGGVNANVVSCNETKVGDVTVEVKDNHVLSGNELSVLEDSLNNADVDVNVLTVGDLTVLETVVVDTYKSFNPSVDVDVDDVNVCSGVLNKCV